MLNPQWGAAVVWAVVGAMNMLEHDGAVAAQRARPAARCPKGFNPNTATDATTATNLYALLFSALLCRESSDPV